MHVLRIYHRQIVMVAVFFLPPALFAVPSALFAVTPGLPVVTTTLFVVAPWLDVDIPRLGTVTSALPTPETPSNAREQQCQGDHLLKHGGLLPVRECWMRFIRIWLRCYVRHRFR
jgi:hypothetical protein